MASPGQENGIFADTEQDIRDEEVSDSRQRLRPWLISRLNSRTIPGLEWLDRNKQIFKVPWKHGGKQDWVPEQSQIFKDWACHTGKFREGVDTPTYAKWKTNLRCALNKAPDITELTHLTKKSDPNPFKVYQFLKRKKKAHPVPAVAPIPQPKPTTVTLPSKVPPVPSFLNDYSSPTAGHENADDNFGKPDFMQPPSRMLEAGAEDISPTVGFGHIGEGAMPGGSVWNIPITPQNELMMNTYRESTLEDMDFDSVLPQASTAVTPVSSACFTTPMGGCLNVPPDGQTELMYPLQGSLTSHLLPNQPVTSDPMQDQCIPVYSTAQNDLNKTEDTPETHLPFDKSVTSHSCVSETGSEMYLEVIYRNHLVTSQHIQMQSRGCRITHTVVARNLEEEIPDVIKDALFGPDSKDREVVELPQWPESLCLPHLLPSVNDLLKNMHRGIILECHSGNIYATRLCKTSLYYSSEYTQATQKLMRYDDCIEKTMVFDMENYFLPNLERYGREKGFKRPSPYVYLYIGQKGIESDLGSLLIAVRLTSCRALTLLNEVDQRRCLDHSLHISRSTELDQLSECVRKQLNGQLHL